MSETFYDLLGVDEDATTEEIEAAYRERLKETHPDVSDAEDAGEVTRTLVEARDVLVDEAERERYDRLGHAAYVGTASGVDEGDAASSSPTAGEDRVDATTDVSNTESERRARGRAERERRATERVRAERNARGSESRAAGGGGDASAWYATDGYAVRESATSSPGYERLRPSRRELTLLGLAGPLYPLLLTSAFLPAFPLPVNVVLGVCVLLVVGYLQSAPRVALVVFGGWSLLAMPALAALDVGLLSLVGVATLFGTWLPFGLSVLTYAALRL